MCMEFVAFIIATDEKPTDSLGIQKIDFFLYASRFSFFCASIQFKAIMDVATSELNTRVVFDSL